MAETVDTVEELQRKLQEQIASLAAQRAEESKRFQVELEERNKLAEIERQQNIEAYNKRLAQHLKDEAAQKEAATAERRECNRVKAEAEFARAQADTAKKELEEKLEQLKVDIANQEFIEEQHRKAMDTLRKTKPAPESTEPAFSVENPTAPVNGGNSVSGTDGVEKGPLMSDHLKHILRQAHR